MSTKLTLTVDKQIIEEAKKYAHSKGRSLSNIIEEYLKTLVHSNAKHDKSLEISPLVNSLWGSVKSLPDDVDYRVILEEELAKKYLR